MPTPNKIARKEEFHSLPSEGLITWSEIFMLYKGKRLINSHLPHPSMLFFLFTSFCAVPNNLNVWKRLPGGTPIWKGRGYSSEILTLTPKGDQSGRGPTFFHLQETFLNFDYMNRVNIANWKYIFLYFLTYNPKRPLRLNILAFCPEHLKIQNFYP